MAKGCKKIWKLFVGLGFAACGASKIMGITSQEKRFSDLNWSQSNMKMIGGAEVAGAAMLACKKTSKLGAFILFASALCLFTTGLIHKRKQELALDGLGIFAALSLFRCKKK